MTRPRNLFETTKRLKNVMRHFRPYILKQRALIAKSFLALFAGIALRLLEPWPLKFVFDRIIPGRSKIDFADPIVLLTFSAVMIVITVAARAIADYFNTLYFALIGTKVLTQIRTELYRHLQYLSLSFHNKAREGDLIVRVTSDVNMLKEITVTALLPLLANFLILIAMVAVMLWLHWKLALCSLAMLPLFWISTLRLGRRIHEAARLQRKREGAMASTAAESIGAIKIVQSLSLESTFLQSFSNKSEKGSIEELKSSRLSASLERSVDILIGITTAIVVWYGAQLVLSKVLTAGDLLVFLNYLKRAFHPLQDFAKYTSRLAKATAAGERVVDVLERKPEICDLPGAVAADVFQGDVRFECVSFAYEPEKKVLDEIDFHVRPGEHVALIGPSGIGKSTIAGLISRLYDPQKGSVKIDGKDIRDYTLESLRLQLSIVLQESILFAASVSENIALGSNGSTQQEIESAAILANADEFIRALPDGYNTILGERGVTLSHGQRQRIAIARAAIRKAPILILDEPATGLDEENERTVIDALQRLAAGKTTFLITHNLQFAARCDTILYLEGGRVLERGTHSELIKAGGRYSSLYASQTSTFQSSFKQVSNAFTA